MINIDFLNYSSNEYLIFKLVHTLGSIGLTLTLFSCIFFGIRKVKINKQDIFGRKLMISGIILFLILFLFSLIGYRLMAKMYNITGTAKDIKRIEKMLNTPGLPLERKQKLSYLLAAETFAQKGKLINFFNQDGNLQLYKATKEDKEIMKTKLLYEKTTQSLKSSAIIWAGILITSILLGISMPLKKQKL